MDAWLRIAVLGSNTKQKRLQESNGQNFGGKEALKSRGRGPGEKPSWEETRSSGH